MALKPTIYKFSISVTDVDAGRYEDVNLTVALHPSETLERMMARVLAFCLCGGERLTFTKGLSEADEPDLWRHALDGRIEQWIEVGEPSVDRLKKARGQADEVRVFAFNSKADAWWRDNARVLSSIGVRVTRFEWSQIQQLAGWVERTLALSLTIDGDSAFVACDAEACELSWTHLTD